MTGKLDGALRFHQTALAMRAARQQLLASNIANADTPGYKARDVDFARALQSTLGGSGGTTLTPLKTATGHLGGGAGSVAAAVRAEPQYRSDVQGGVDGNTVDLDVERNQFADNALRYEAGLALVGSQVKSLLTAIQGQ